MFRSAILFSFLLFIKIPVFATITLPAIFANNMVLQQDSEVGLWGTAGTNKDVRITTSWNHQVYLVKSDNKGSWKIKVQTPPAGGPYEIVFDDGNISKLTNILIGEVWICSGQSNMEIPLKGYRNTPVLNSNDILMHAEDPQLRLFHLERAVSNDPLSDCKGSWELSNSESAEDFSAVGFQFAKMLQEILKVPVGIIETSWGGTPIEAWMNKSNLAGIPKESMPSSANSMQEQLHPTQPACLFNAMIAPVAGYGIRGFIWYQGERNAVYPAQYDLKMKLLVDAWRIAWENNDLPFYYVQLAPYQYEKLRRDSVAFLREAQMKAQEEISHSGMVVSIDAGNEYTIHPPDKTIIATRLAYWALGDTYKKEIAYKSPEYKSMTINENKVVISFDFAENGLTSFDKRITGFEVAGADRKFYPADAQITGKGSVKVKSENVLNPIAVRYAFTDWVVGTLYNTRGLPVAPFRSDNW